MKLPVILAFLLSLAGAAWYLGGSSQKATDARMVGSTDNVDAPAPPTSTNKDRVEVFQRAFWKRPTKDDEILHAERHEWSDGDGVDRWQWFIEVDPSVQLARYLHDQNPFSMIESKGDVAVPQDHRPDWFPETSDGFEVKQTADGQMIMFVRPSDGRLYAASQGRGFAKAVEAPPSSPVVQTTSPQGRLPTTPPPTPSKP